MGYARTKGEALRKGKTKWGKDLFPGPKARDDILII